MRALAVVPIALGLVGGAARAAPAGFQPGEGLTFSLSVGPIPAGRARMSVGQPVAQKGRRVAAAHGEAHSADWLRLIARLDDDYKVVFDADALLPRTVSSVETGVRERNIETAYDGQRLVIDFTAPKQRAHQARLLPGLARDPMMTLFALRAAPLRDGDVIVALVLDGPALYRATCRVKGRQALERSDGKAAAIRVDVEALRVDDRNRPSGLPARHITIWLSDDDRRIPYRVSGDTDLGTANVELTSYVAPPPDGAHAARAHREGPVARHEERR